MRAFAALALGHQQQDCHHLPSRSSWQAQGQVQTAHWAGPGEKAPLTLTAGAQGPAAGLCRPCLCWEVSLPTGRGSWGPGLQPGTENGRATKDGHSWETELIRLTTQGLTRALLDLLRLRGSQRSCCLPSPPCLLLWVPTHNSIQQLLQPVLARLSSLNQASLPPPPLKLLHSLLPWYLLLGTPRLTHRAMSSLSMTPL